MRYLFSVLLPTTFSSTKIPSGTRTWRLLPFLLLLQGVLTAQAVPPVNDAF